MNSLTILSIVCAAASLLTAQVQAYESDPTTRAQVIAELNAARASGGMPALVGEDSGSAWLASQRTASTMTRRQARDDTIAACAQGRCTAMVGEDGGSWLMSMAAAPAQRTRAEVVAEVRQARAQGQACAACGEDSGSAAQSQQQAKSLLRYAGQDAPTPGQAVDVTALQQRK